MDKYNPRKSRDQTDGGRIFLNHDLTFKTCGSEDNVKSLIDRMSNQKHSRKVIILRHPKPKSTLSEEPPNKQVTSNVTGMSTVLSSTFKSTESRNTATTLQSVQRNSLHDTMLNNLQSRDKHNMNTTCGMTSIQNRTSLLGNNSYVMYPNMVEKNCTRKTSMTQSYNSATQQGVRMASATMVPMRKQSKEAVTEVIQPGEQTRLKPQDAMNDSLTNITWLGGASVNPNLEIKVENERSKSIRKESPHKRPSYSYMSMIQFAINSKPDKKMTLQEIYHWVESTFPYFQSAKPGWKNSIRHNLSLHDVFVREKPEVNGKSSFWKLKEEEKQIKVQPFTGYSVPGARSKNTPILPRLTQSYAIIPIPLMVQAMPCISSPVLTPSLPITSTPAPNFFTPSGPESTMTMRPMCLSKNLKRYAQESNGEPGNKKVKIAPKLLTTDSCESNARVSTRYTFNGSSPHISINQDSGMDSMISETEHCVTHQPTIGRLPMPEIPRKKHGRKSRRPHKIVKDEDQQENVHFDVSFSEIFPPFDGLESSPLRGLMKTPPKIGITFTSTPNKNMSNIDGLTSFGFTPLKTLDHIDSGIESSHRSSNRKFGNNLTPLVNNFSSPGVNRFSDMIGFSNDLVLTPDATKAVDCIDGSAFNFDFASPKLLTPNKFKLNKSTDGDDSLRIGSLSDLGLTGLTPMKENKMESNQSFTKLWNDVSFSGIMGEDDLGNISWSNLQSIN
ncbi:uncharacterized protein LOC100328990 isoform X2 [Saccoglossus kowalevskii]|uniref:Forkhead box protein M1 isoform X2 n=1 Tax=Saccoglossus kowalevskii TaxID=10224 RepID=A0ABM0LZ45_SACKO|nr:PREDICTED: forkhead box protein M1 isoform X2 [Saccoglossus kowalevskii]